MIDRVQTDYLLARPSFASGAASTFDLWGSFNAYNGASSPAEADAQAIYSDWAVIGQDIYDAIQRVDSELEAA